MMQILVVGIVCERVSFLGLPSFRPMIRETDGRLYTSILACTLPIYSLIMGLASERFLLYSGWKRWNKTTSRRVNSPHGGTCFFTSLNMWAMISIRAWYFHAIDEKRFDDEIQGLNVTAPVLSVWPYVQLAMIMQIFNSNSILNLRTISSHVNQQPTNHAPLIPISLAYPCSHSHTPLPVWTRPRQVMLTYYLNLSFFFFFFFFTKVNAHLRSA